MRNLPSEASLISKKAGLPRHLKMARNDGLNKLRVENGKIKDPFSRLWRQISQQFLNSEGASSAALSQIES